ncbi:MAG: 16S rRNA (cytidine(1402)-2'-O)-methyltransferase [Desulfuromonadales bacterium C00003094]|nr:MAG: 16S rRNA (cytidine(1402)-2'-O)-methyltransferase [Desulfuromonadales bacterium C00003094]OEU74272.1 MAG: 16S rRNA (cytidine(1402)-2'-O)-methyltransferase [Desulfuromonadales bacterium C00003107]
MTTKGTGEHCCGTLYVVATPIGNLEDLTPRALRILREVDLVAAEDTRHSRKLFNHYGIETPLTSYFQHNEAAKGEKLLHTLLEGRDVALISDAGTPAISDPGCLLVQRCHEAGVLVSAIPGPSALIAALSMAGLPTERFAFEGFLPAKTHARCQVLRALRQEQRTTVFYEAPHRLVAALQDVLAELGEGRQVAIVRELTKVHEELFRGTAAEACEHFQGKVRGEIVLLIGPAEQSAPEESVQDALRRWRTETDLPMREIVKQVAKVYGLSGSEVYKESLALREEEE